MDCHGVLDSYCWLKYEQNDYWGKIMTIIITYVAYEEKNEKKICTYVI